MKKCFLGISILVLTIGFYSCSKDEVKSQNQETNRPSVPVQVGEVQIGNQIWMTKNLNVSRYRNGDPIPQVTDPVQWANLTTGAWCYNENSTANGVVYGKLYNWYAVNDPRGLAPTGWHIPNTSEWGLIKTSLGGLSVSGGKMKTTTLWAYPNMGATNSSGFNGTPGGRRMPNGDFVQPGYGGLWWHSGQIINNEWFAEVLVYNSDMGSSWNYERTSGFSVRCVKD